MTSYRRKEVNSSVLTHQSRELESREQEVRLLATDNSRLKAENSRLRRDIERKQTSDISNETMLQDRLYQSNKALQESIMNLDLCGRANKELQEKLVRCEVVNEQLKVERQALSEQLEKYKNKLKKSMEINRNSRAKEQPDPRTNDALLDKFKEMAARNKELELLVEQLQEELSRTSTSVRPEMGWVRKTAKKINSIEQNITRIQENHQEINDMKEQLEALHNEFKNKMSIVASCQDYVEQQLAAAAKGCFSAGVGGQFSRGFQLVELNRVASMMTSGDLKDIIVKMNLSGALSKLLNGIAVHVFELLTTLTLEVEGKIRRVDSQLKTAERKLANLSKQISNNRLKSRTERTRLRHMSLLGKIENKENIDLSN